MTSDPSACLALEAEGLCRGYGSRWALAGLNLRMRPGNSLLVAGANGAGKTTLLRLLATTLRPTGGSLRIFGRAPEDDLLQVRRRLGLLSHRTHLYDDLTARELLAVTDAIGGFGQGTARHEALLERVGLEGRGHETIRGFSAGMRKRLSFARLLLQDPDIVLLDEPYGQLDPRGVRFVDGLVNELLATDKTLVMSTHHVDRAAAMLAQGLVLASGRMHWVGPAKDVPEALAESLRQ
ncbi:MAG: ABC transporter ATP-binding protein [Myxococcota bacterium]|nr:ABC transporter ATP-binding protein [Myxococcota bacterium]